jgi:hypothetical protein
MALVNGVSLTDASASAFVDVSVGPGPLDAGVVVRENTIKNLWGAGLFHKANDNTFHLEMGYIVNNILHLVFFGPSIGVSSGIVRLDVVGTTESLYFNNNVVFQMTSNISEIGTISAGSLNMITGLADTSKLFIGEEVEGPNLPPATPAVTTTITAITSNSVTLSQSATAAVGSGTFTFAPGPTAAGLIGIGDKHGGARFGDGSNAVHFELDSLGAPTLPFSDNFNQSRLSGLGNPWSVTEGGFSISGGQAVAAAAQSEAFILGLSLTTVDESVDITAGGTSAGLLARASNSGGYLALLTGTSLQLFSVINNVPTLIGSATTASATGTLRLTVSGNTLQVFFTGSVLPLINTTDNSIGGPGGVGLFTGGSAVFDNYLLSGS